MSEHPTEETPPGRPAATLRELVGDLAVQFWACPHAGHSQAQTPPRPTVEWVEDVAHCLEPGCGATSADPPDEEATSRRERLATLLCESGCGPCTCHPDYTSRGRRDPTCMHHEVDPHFQADELLAALPGLADLL